MNEQQFVLFFVHVHRNTLPTWESLETGSKPPRAGLRVCLNVVSADDSTFVGGEDHGIGWALRVPIRKHPECDYHRGQQQSPR
jgi:hypothetical protein